MGDILRMNLLSPIALACALGLLARVIRSEFSLPREFYAGLSIYLLWALGLQGGRELSHAALGWILLPALVTLLIGCITPLTAYLTLRRVSGFSVADRRRYRCALRFDRLGQLCTRYSRHARRSPAVWRGSVAAMHSA